MSFERALALTLRYEGGFSNNPADRGGPTFAGVSHKAVVGLRDDGGRLVFDLDGDGDVDADDIRALASHPDKVEAFYRARYWAPAGCEELSWPYSLLVFDAAVHSGPRQGVVLFQNALGTSADGKFGPASRDVLAVATARWGLPRVVRSALWERMKLFLAICNKNSSQSVFLLGWLRRLVALEKEAIS